MKRHCAFFEPGASLPRSKSPNEMEDSIPLGYVAPSWGSYLVKKDHFGNVMKCTTWECDETHDSLGSGAKRVFRLGKYEGRKGKVSTFLLFVDFC